MEDRRDNNMPALSGESKDIVDKVVQTNDAAELKDLTDAFNLIQQKKNMLRVSKYGELLDQLYDQILLRVQQRPGEFSNKDLLDYFRTIQGSISNNGALTGEVEVTPTIQMTQNNINITPEISRESASKITDAVRTILDKMEGFNNKSFDEENYVEKDSTNS